MSEPIDQTNNSSYIEILDKLKEYKPFDENLRWDTDKLENPPVDINTDILKLLLLSNERYNYDDVKECFDSDTNLLLTTMSVISNRFYSRNIDKFSDSKVFTRNEETLIFSGYSYLRKLYSENNDNSLIPLIQSTRENIIHSNIRLVGYCLFTRYSFLTESVKSVCNVRNNDLFQEAFFALINACDTFRVENGVSFSSYAQVCLRNFLLNYKHRKHIIETTSLDSLETDIACPDCFERTMEKRILIKELFESNSILTSKEKQVLQLRYGLNQNNYEEGPTYTLNEIGEASGVTYQRVLQIQNMAETKLRREMFRIRKQMLRKGYANIDLD